MENKSSLKVAFEFIEKLNLLKFLPHKILNSILSAWRYLSRLCEALRTHASHSIMKTN